MEICTVYQKMTFIFKLLSSILKTRFTRSCLLYTSYKGRLLDLLTSFSPFFVCLFVCCWIYFYFILKSLYACEILYPPIYRGGAWNDDFQIQRSACEIGHEWITSPVRYLFRLAHFRRKHTPAHRWKTNEQVSHLKWTSRILTSEIHLSSHIFEM